MGLPAERNEPYDYDKVITAYKYAVELACASKDAKASRYIKRKLEKAPDGAF